MPSSKWNGIIMWWIVTEVMPFWQYLLRRFSEYRKKNFPFLKHQVDLLNSTSLITYWLPIYVRLGSMKLSGVLTVIAMHCRCRIFKMAAKIEKLPKLYVVFFDWYSSFLRKFSTVTWTYTYLGFFCAEKKIYSSLQSKTRSTKIHPLRAWNFNPLFREL